MTNPGGGFIFSIGGVTLPLLPGGGAVGGCVGGCVGGVVGGCVGGGLFPGGGFTFPPGGGLVSPPGGGLVSPPGGGFITGGGFCTFAVVHRANSVWLLGFVTFSVAVIRVPLFASVNQPAKMNPFLEGELKLPYAWPKVTFLGCGIPVTISVPAFALKLTVTETASHLACRVIGLFFGKSANRDVAVT
jgi:hypothetical protein